MSSSCQRLLTGGWGISDIRVLDLGSGPVHLTARVEICHCKLKNQFY